MIKGMTVLSAAIAMMSLFCLAVASAQITETKVIASDGRTYDHFGSSVSISGEYAFVGAEWGGGGTNEGAVYVFRRDGSNWLEIATLVASDPSSTDEFGSSISVDGDFAIIAAGNGGAVYVFQNDGSNWVEQAKLVASDYDLYDYFGSSVSMDGDFAIVGAWLDDSTGRNGGSAYIFQYDGLSWIEHTKIVASDGSEEDHFGVSVSISGNYAIVGAHEDDPNGYNSGSAYIFHFDGSNWTELIKLSPSDGEARDLFGQAVSISGEYAFVGSSEDNHSVLGEDVGSAYVFHLEGSTWVEQAKLGASDANENDYFGESVSISGDRAVIGAMYATRGGSAYIFHRDGSEWVEQAKLTASDWSSGNQFGSSVSLSGEYALVGAPWDNDNGLYSGSAYVYSATAACDKISQFQARCRAGGLIKARVTMADASHEGDVIEISIDDVSYEVTIDATGRGQLSQGGFSSGPHTVELTNPGQCVDPIVVTCRTSLDEAASDDWDDELVSEAPVETSLLGNYPNPFNPSTTIRYILSNDGSVSIRVYNMLGQEVATLVDGFQKAGEQSVTWHGTNNFGQPVASGLYIYKFQTGNSFMTRKMLFTR